MRDWVDDPGSCYRRHPSKRRPMKILSSYHPRTLYDTFSSVFFFSPYVQLAVCLFCSGTVPTIARSFPSIASERTVTQSEVSSHGIVVAQNSVISMATLALPILTCKLVVSVRLPVCVWRFVFSFDCSPRSFLHRGKCVWSLCPKTICCVSALSLNNRKGKASGTTRPVGQRSARAIFLPIDDCVRRPIGLAYYIHVFAIAVMLQFGNATLNRLWNVLCITTFRYLLSNHYSFDSWTDGGRGHPKGMSCSRACYGMMTTTTATMRGRTNERKQNRVERKNRGYTHLSVFASLVVFWFAVWFLYRISTIGYAKSYPIVFALRRFFFDYNPISEVYYFYLSTGRIGKLRGVI